MKYQYPTIRFIHNRRNVDTNVSLATVEMEVMFERKRKWFSTGVRVASRNWNDKKKVVGSQKGL